MHSNSTSSNVDGKDGNGHNQRSNLRSSLKNEGGRVKSLKFDVGGNDGNDPLSNLTPPPPPPVETPTISKKANLMIRLEDEVRIVASIHDAAKRLTSGSIFSVLVDISKTGTLDIGVKDLNENVLAVSLLKRENDQPGAGEAAGIRLGDVIFGVNFIPTREGSKTLISIIRMETEKKKRFIHLQAWRCHQLCSDEIPGYQFPRANDMFVHSYSLFRTKVFNEWERWNFVEILLSHLVEDLRLLSEKVEGIEKNSSHVVRQKQMQVLDLERNILQAKGLRTSLNVRIVQTKFKDDAVSYILRIEDIESGLHWSISKRYHEFFSFYEELREMCPYTRDLEFPRKRVALKNSPKVVEARIIGLELFVRKALHTLTLYASMDNSASKGLRHLQQFLGVDRKIDCIHPPPMDDQRTIEIMAYQFLNDYNSPACQQCVRFTNSVDLDAVCEVGEDGYKSLLTFLHDALAEVEQFVQQQHEQQLVSLLSNRRPDWTQEQRLKLVRLCIRRQVESALYLPLRRTVFRIVQSYVAERSRKLQRAISLLQQAKPSVFMVDYEILRTTTLPKAMKAFRKAITSYLPVDQGQFLVESAKIIAELHGEIREIKAADLEESKAQAQSMSSPLITSIPSSSVSKSSTPITTSKPPLGKRNSPSTPPIARVPSDTGSEKSGTSRLSFTGVFGSSSGNNTKIERRPSLQDRMKEYAESDKAKSNSTYDEEDEGEVEEDNVSRVSFAVGPNLAIQYSNKRVITEKEKKPLATSMREMKVSDQSVTVTPSKEDHHKDEKNGKISPSGQVSKEDTSLNYEEDRTSFSGMKETEKTKTNSTQKDNEDSVVTTNNADKDNNIAKATGTPNLSDSPAPSPSNLVRRRSMSRPTSILRKVSSEEMMNDPLLRPLAIELAGTTIDKQYFEEVFDRYNQQSFSYQENQEEEDMINNAISADDFLPLFTYVLVHAGVPHLFLLKELMVALISNEDAYGECGYYLATMEAAIQHILDIASQYEGIFSSDGFYEDNEDIFDLKPPMFGKKN